MGEQWCHSWKSVDAITLHTLWIYSPMSSHKTGSSSLPVKRVSHGYKHIKMIGIEGSLLGLICK